MGTFALIIKVYLSFQVFLNVCLMYSLLFTPSLNCAAKLASQIGNVLSPFRFYNTKFHFSMRTDWISPLLYLFTFLLIYKKVLIKYATCLLKYIDAGYIVIHTHMYRLSTNIPLLNEPFFIRKMIFKVNFILHSSPLPLLNLSFERKWH